MSLRKMSGSTLLSSALLFVVVPLRTAEAQDVDVPGNLTMHDSTDPTVGNVLKEGVPFLHNFGINNTFLGSGAGNFTMSGFGGNTATGFHALQSNTFGQSNTASGVNALSSNTNGNFDTATGEGALFRNTEGQHNTALGTGALGGNATGNFNTALGRYADVAAEDLSNATAIGNGAIVDASNKIRIGNADVTVIEGQVPYTYTSDRNEKENFHAVDAEAVSQRKR